LFETKYNRNEKKFTEALNKKPNEVVEEGLSPEEIEKLKKEAEEIKKQCKGE